MDESGDTTSISFRVSEDLLEDFDRELKRAQADGVLPLNTSRSEAIRRLMEKAVGDPEMFSEDE